MLGVGVDLASKLGSKSGVPKTVFSSSDSALCDSRSIASRSQGLF